ncbi:SMI1/KNR4 family protein [Actinokineospora globicatena]|uniref:SMI1/KNR4 family protein n=1 Tax=Actinokineospora globicatena TaxID=103729 RepID=A0A9W6QQ20_9PSEU|nr:SMI1/KNR4 family protein [Actinokineospora globicatena]GLW92710.1 hypothetical protein Aglo03_35260 [Actinokineospora globicatena]
MDHLEKLLRAASGPTCPAASGDDLAELLPEWGRVGGELASLLGWRNGFYGFLSALHLRGLGGETPAGLVGWNSAGCWREAFGGLADGRLYFAEDIFGFQFAIAAGGEAVVAFDSETGQVEEVADSLDGWAEVILEEPEYRTGFPLARAWQERNGALAAGTRLFPKLPFFAGGKYKIENLYASDAVTGMRARGSIAVQIKDLPDGTRIEFQIE